MFHQEIGAPKQDGQSLSARGHVATPPDTKLDMFDNRRKGCAQ